MTLTSSKPWLVQAQAETWALGAFNANTLEQVQAIVLAAQEETAPVVVQISHRALYHLGNGNPVYGLRYIAEIGKIAAQSVEVPVVLHLDHGTEYEIIQAISLGFTSVMFDGSHLPFEENLRKSEALCKLAHQIGVCFEAELGAVPKPGDSEADGDDQPTNPDFVVEFVERTGLDALAISIGSVHGMTNKAIALNLDLLNSIRRKVTVPLVLHGSSGVTDSSLIDGIQRGLSKVNIATLLNQAFSETVRHYMFTNPQTPDPRIYLNQAREAVKECVRERMVFLGASGKARGRSNEHLVC